MILTIVYGILIIATLLYVWLSWRWTFWTKKGVYQIQPTFPFGTFSSFFTKKHHIYDQFILEAKECEKVPYYGGYFLHMPVFIVKDADVVKKILAKDFDHFIDRQDPKFIEMFANGLPTDKIWSKQLQNVTGSEWKDLRYEQ